MHQLLLTTTVRYHSKADFSVDYLFGLSFLCNVNTSVALMAKEESKMSFEADVLNLFLWAFYIEVVQYIIDFARYHMVNYQLFKGPFHILCVGHKR